MPIRSQSAGLFQFSIPLLLTPLKDPARSVEDRRFALRFLIHLVQDLQCASAEPRPPWPPRRHPSPRATDYWCQDYWYQFFFRRKKKTIGVSSVLKEKQN